MVASRIAETLATVSVSFLTGWVLQRVYSRNLLRKLTRNVSSETKLVLVVRSDVGMTKGKIASQCSHAAVCCYKTALGQCPSVLSHWEETGQRKIVVRLDGGGEEGLVQLAGRAAAEGLVTALIRDAGHTQVSSGTATVLGIGPGSATAIGKLTAHLRLL